MKAQPPIADDEAFLDEILEFALQRGAVGDRVDIEELCEGREALRPRIAAVLALARELAPATVPPGKAGWPSVPGFTILADAGAGGMGVVYRARQDGLDRTVALKMLKPALADSDRARARFAREAAALSLVRHPNVVTVHAVLASDAVVAYAMEWVEGSTLARALATNGPMDGRAVAALGAAVAGALQAVHAQQLVHRDVKPANILLRADGTPLLSDFGLVRDRVSSLQTGEGQFIGTAGYAAPEQLAGEQAAIGPWTDIYGLGATLYHALTGSPPIAPCSTAEMRRRATAADYLPILAARPDVATGLAAVVQKAMHPEPHQRYAAAAEMAADLERCLRGVPSTAGAAAAMGRRRRLPRLATFAALLAVALAVALAAWSGERRQRQRVEHRNYIAGINAAAAALDAGEHQRAAALLQAAPVDLRGFEWGLLAHRLEAVEHVQHPTGMQRVGALLVDPLNRWLLFAGTGAGESLVALGPLPPRVGERILLREPGGAPRRMHVSGDGARVVVTAGDRVLVFAGDDLALAALPGSDSTPVPRREIRCQGAPTAAVVLADGETLLLGDDRGLVRCAPGQAAAELVPALSGPVHAIAVEPRGMFVVVAAASGVAAFDRDSDYRSLSRLTTTAAHAVAFTAAGDLLAVADDSAITFRQTGTWQVRGRAIGAGPVRSMAFGSAGKRLAVVAGDVALRLWDVAAGVEVLQLRHGDAVEGLAWTRCGGRLLCSSGGSLFVRTAAAQPARSR
jgi:hypothetical protein